MKKVFLIFSLALLVPVAVWGIDLGSGLAQEAAVGAGYSAATDETTLSQTLGTVIKGALSFVGVIFLGLMVYAGYLWGNARGKEDQIEKAQAVIRAAVIGLIIAVGAYGITNVVVNQIIDRTAGEPSKSGPGTCSWQTDTGSGQRSPVNSATECRTICRSIPNVDMTTCVFR